MINQSSDQSSTRTAILRRCFTSELRLDRVTKYFFVRFNLITQLSSLSFSQKVEISVELRLLFEALTFLFEMLEDVR